MTIAVIDKERKMVAFSNHYCDVQKISDTLKHWAKNITKSQIINKSMPRQGDPY